MILRSFLNFIPKKGNKDKWLDQFDFNKQLDKALLIPQKSYKTFSPSFSLITGFKLSQQYFK
jgi:hypothetical protein